MDNTLTRPIDFEPQLTDVPCHQCNQPVVALRPEALALLANGDGHACICHCCMQRNRLRAERAAAEAVAV